MASIPVLASTAGATDPAGTGKPAPVTLQYGPETLETAAVYPATTPNSPIIVLVHGGGFRSSATVSLEPLVAKDLQTDGFLVFDANYSDDVGGAFPVQPNDIVTATNVARLVAPWFNGDASRVTLLGGSSGGLLVALAAESLDDAGTPVRHVITLSSPFDFVRLMSYWASLNNNTGRVHIDEDSMALNCRGTTCTQNLEQTWSPFGHVNANARATSWLLFNGTNELMPPEQADVMAYDLAIFGVPVTEEVFSDTAHSFSYFSVVRSQVDSFASQ